MTDTQDHSHENEEPDDNPASLYVTDAQIIRKLGYGLKRGYRLIHSLDRGVKNFRPYPQPDPLFCNRRFWPEVLQWHLDYHRVRTPGEAKSVTTVQPMWQENFDAAPRKARGTGHARPELARA